MRANLIATSRSTARCSRTSYDRKIMAVLKHDLNGENFGQAALVGKPRQLDTGAIERQAEKSARKPSTRWSAVACWCSAAIYAARKASALVLAGERFGG
ncbi:hypothetical protein ACXX9E_29455 [Pseudomonas sp. GNP014]